MDFGLDAFVAVAPPTGARTPPQANAGGAEDDATAFAAHLADTEDGTASEVVAQSSDDAVAANAEILAGPTAIPLQPAQILLQLIGRDAATSDASAEIAVGGEAKAAPPAPGLQAGADTAKAAPVLNDVKPQPTPATTAPLPAPTAETAAAAPLGDAAISPPPGAPTTKPADAALAANNATPPSAAPPSAAVSATKPTAKSVSAPKFVAAETTPTAAAGELLGAESEATTQPVRDASTSRDPRAGAPQGDGRNARAEPAFAISADSGAAPAPALQTGSTPSGAMPATAVGIGDSAPLTQSRAAETAPAATQVAQEIVRRFDGDKTHFEVRLDPPELGRVEVRLEVTRDNKVSATVVADSPQTLVELARHARDLQNSLQAAGLDLADNGLSFDLRDSGREAHNARANADGRGAASANDTAKDDVVPLARASGLDPWRGRTLDMTA